jgi:hypothetical protein
MIGGGGGRGDDDLGDADDNGIEELEEDLNQE